MSVQQSAFNFETPDRKLGCVKIYAYIEIPKNNAYVYIGQSVHPYGRYSGHLSGDTEFDRELQSRPDDFKYAVLETVEDIPGGPIVSARELDLIEFQGTWIELGVGYNRRAKRTWLQIAAAYFKGFGVKPDFMGGDGPFAEVRECRRWHKKGDHWNWYRHIVYRLHRKLSTAQQFLSTGCYPLDKIRNTESDVDCKMEKHGIVEFYWDRSLRLWKTRIVQSQVTEEEERLPF